MAARRHFGSFAIRLAAIIVDFTAVFVVLALAMPRLPGIAGLSGHAGTAVMAATAILYFAACWASPLRATPAQFLLGLRVIDEAGGALPWVRALVRSGALIGVIVLTLWVLRPPQQLTHIGGAIVAFAAVFLAAVTPARQALHDVLAGSLVVNRAWVESNPAKWPRDKPAPHVIGANLLVLAAPVYGLWSVAQIINDRDMLFRTNYAIVETGVLQTEVEFFYEAEGRFPADHVELGIPASHAYPDGGFFELIDDGVIRIRFEIRPELRDGEILLQPVVDDGDVDWQCSIVGGIRPRHVPSRCRE